MWFTRFTDVALRTVGASTGVAPPEKLVDIV